MKRAGRVGICSPVPETDGQDDTVTELKADIKRLNGATAVVESMSSGWQTGDRNTAPRSDWEAKRLGFDAPASLIQAANMATREILAACGVSPALFEASAAAAAREAWRQLLFGTVAPLGRLVAHELTQKLEVEVTLDWHELRASDLAGRGASFSEHGGRWHGRIESGGAGRAHDPGGRRMKTCPCGRPTVTPHHDHCCCLYPHREVVS